MIRFLATVIYGWICITGGALTERFFGGADQQHPWIVGTIAGISLVALAICFTAALREYER